MEAFVSSARARLSRCSGSLVAGGTAIGPATAAVPHPVSRCVGRQAWHSMAEEYRRKRTGVGASAPRAPPNNQAVTCVDFGSSRDSCQPQTSESKQVHIRGMVYHHRGVSYVSVTGNALPCCATFACSVYMLCHVPLCHAAQAQACCTGPSFCMQGCASKKAQGITQRGTSGAELVTTACLQHGPVLESTRVPCKFHVRREHHQMVQQTTSS